MSTVTVRVTTETRATLRDLAKREGISITDLLTRAVEQYRQEQLIATSNAAYARLRRDSETRRELEREVEEWDVTLADGLEQLE